MKLLRIYFFGFFTLLSSMSHSQDKNDFVLLNDTGFVYQNQPFYPLMINYLINFYRTPDGKLVIGPNHDYGKNNRFNCFNEASCLDDLLDDFKLIKSLGFNSVRLLGVAYDIMKLNDEQGKIPGIYNKDININAYLNEIEPPFEILIDAIEKILNVAECADLKIQILTGGKEVDQPEYIDNYEEFLKTLALKFNDHPALFSYDLLNEPMYFHHAFKNKKEICHHVNRWHEILKTYAPNQWTTVGLSTSSEVFGWDPGILAVDFISFHLYPNFKEEENYNLQKAIDRVNSEIYWFSEVCQKPWMIGEIGFRASVTAKNDIKYVDGTIQEQKDFVKQTLNFTRDCGGAGYGWWQYQDMYWGAAPGSISGDYYGILNRSRMRKPAADVFLQFNPNKEKAIRPPNYYQFYSYRNDTLKGLVYNQHHQPISNAIINGWNKNFGGFTSTYSKEDGSFVLYSDDTIYNIAVSAYGATNQHFYAIDASEINCQLIQHPKALNMVNDCGVPLMNCKDVEKIHLSRKIPLDEKKETQWQVFPEITLENRVYITPQLKENYYIEVRDFKGKVVFSESVTCQGVYPINLPNLTTGSYFIHLISDKGINETHKIAVFKE